MEPVLFKFDQLRIDHWRKESCHGDIQLGVILNHIIRYSFEKVQLLAIFRNEKYFSYCL